MMPARVKVELPADTWAALGYVVHEALVVSPNELGETRITLCGLGAEESDDTALAVDCAACQSRAAVLHV